MIRKVRLILLFLFQLFAFTSSFSQKEGNIWYFGNKAGVDFNSGSPVAILNSAMNTGHGCACISDRCSGDILFYTDGTSVWDGTHTQMPNGSGLLGDRLSTQSAIIVPHPDTNSSEYFIFTVKQSGSGGINYSIVDMNLNGGNGDVVVSSKNSPLISPTVEKLTAVKHQNNVDVWVITHELNSDAFYAYLITKSGLNTTPVISQVGNTYDSDAIKGYMKASPDGAHLAVALRNDNTVELLDFDYATGMVSNPIVFPDNYAGAYGVEFSPDGSKLYVTINSNGLFQFDLDAGSANDIIASEVNLSSTPAVALQLGPDGKIYTNEGRWLGAINDPNIAGVGCNYVSQSVYLGATVFGNSGLPTFLQSYFSPTSIIESGVCLGNTTSFSISNVQQIDSLTWNFGEPSSGVANTSKLLTPTHSYSNPGNFFVELIYYGSVCGNPVADTITKTIEIIDVSPPSTSLGNDTVICPGETVEFSAGSPLATYLWHDGSTDSVFSASSEGTYWVEVTNSCGMDMDTIEVTEFVSDINFNLGNDTSFCAGNSLVLDVTNEESTYLWNNGSTEPTNFITTEGSYWVELKDKCNTFRDSIRVDVLQPPQFNLGQNDTTLCFGNILLLNAASDAAEYKWQDGSTNPIFEVQQSGKYYVNVSNRCGSSREIIDVLYEDCSCSVFAPSAFTPNGDALNSTFKIVYDCQFLEFELKVFNKWGELVYNTTNPAASWDGTLNGSFLPAGTYIYELQYKALNNIETIRSTRRGIISMLK